jgi:hypothetical protein
MLRGHTFGLTTRIDEEDENIMGIQLLLEGAASYPLRETV